MKGKLAKVVGVFVLPLVKSRKSCGSSRKWFSLIIAVGMMFSVAACGGLGQSFEKEKGSAEKITPLIDIWKEELSGNGLSEFERDVLERAVKTGRIEQNDYEQAHAKYLQCMTAAGYDQLKYTKMPDGLYKLSDDSVTDSNYFDKSVQCSEGTTRVIEADFRDQQDNPDRYKDPGIIAVQCLRDAGKVDKNYTAAEFNQSVKEVTAGTNPQDAFAFLVSSSDSQSIYCLSLGGLSLSGDFSSKE